MCMIAAYTGPRQAAPILIDMLRREEGFWSGYYTGIATIDNGKLYYAKVLGDLDELLRTTDAASLPGATGIIHGRTPSGGDREFAHPYVSCDQKLALVENGSSGIFSDKKPFVDAAKYLLSKGHVFTSRIQSAVTKYPVLPDGSCLHVCDIQCHYCEERIHEGDSSLDALIAAETDLLSEDVGVMIHADFPQSVFAARHNQPMTLARTADESFLATSPTAFPADREYIGYDLLPAEAGVSVHPGQYSVKNFRNIPVPVQPITAQVMAQGYEVVMNALKGASAPLSFPEIAELCAAAFTGEGMRQNAALGYAIVDSLLKSGEAALSVVRVPGMVPELTAPKFLISKRTSPAL